MGSNGDQVREATMRRVRRHIRTGIETGREAGEVTDEVVRQYDLTAAEAALARTIARNQSGRTPGRGRQEAQPGQKG
jgi:hypothetical protein